MNSTKSASPVLAGKRSYSEAFDHALAKTRRNLPLLAAHPTSWSVDPEGNYANWDEGFFDIGNWTTSFFTGMSILGYCKTDDPQWLSRLEPLKPFYQKKISEHRDETMHDIGFLYSLYSVALHQVTKDESHRQSGLKAAAVLADRFVPAGSYIRAWGRMDEPHTDYAGLAIIDCLMNMPLLYWASRESGDPRFREIAIRHTDTTLKYFIRPDHSVCHAFRFDPVTGEPIGWDNYCGRSVDSQWARGTAWAMYGFALAYRHVGDLRYLDAALKLTGFFISQLDEEIVPVWDFCLEPGDPPIRDSSAAAIAACAIRELESLHHATPAMIRTKAALLERLCSDDYLDTSPKCPGLLKHGQFGAGSVGTARSVYTSWGDYYLTEALAREIGLEVTWW